MNLIWIRGRGHATRKEREREPNEILALTLTLIRCFETPPSPPSNPKKISGGEEANNTIVWISGEEFSMYRLLWNLIVCHFGEDILFFAMFWCFVFRILSQISVVRFEPFKTVVNLFWDLLQRVETWCGGKLGEKWERHRATTHAMMSSKYALKRRRNSWRGKGGVELWLLIPVPGLGAHDAQLQSQLALVCEGFHRKHVGNWKCARIWLGAPFCDGVFWPRLSTSLGKLCAPP